MTLIITLLYILFVLAAIVLVVVILLQEGKGGGLTDALGTSGQATFGVGASGINRFTGATAFVFLASALLIHILNRQQTEGLMGTFGQTEQIAPPANGQAPATPAGGGTAPAGQPPAPTGGGSTPPSGGNGGQPQEPK